MCTAARAELGVVAPKYDNPFFNGYGHQIALHLGTGVNSGFLIPPPSQFVPFANIQIQYSIPNTFFELPARQSLNVAITAGYGRRYRWDWDDYSNPIALFSEDVALFWGQNWYFGAGIGAGMQAHQNERLGSKLVFQFKLMAGFKLNAKTNMEIFVQHFSNGNTAENHSYAFYGLGAVYSF
jgi:hypothetical protein